MLKRKIRVNTLKQRKQHQKFKNCTTQIYIFKLDNDRYKIGCSDNVEKRLKAGKTWSNHIEHIASRKIPPMKSANWRYYEKKVQTRFSTMRAKDGGTEIFMFDNKAATAAISFLKNMKF